MIIENKRQSFVKLLVLGDIRTEVRDTLELDGKQINYFILGTEDGGVYVDIEKVLIHKDADINVVMDEVGHIVNEYLRMKLMMEPQDTLN